MYSYGQIKRNNSKKFSERIDYPRKKQENSDINLTLGQQVNIGDIIDKQKKKYIQAALKTTGYNKSKAANMLGLKSHQVLTKWMNDLAIEN